MLKVLLPVFGLLINIACVSSSSIFDSIFWDPHNPLFRDKSQSCSTGYMTLKVRLQSKVFFICPNTATVLQKTLTAPQSATMYENLWIVYNRSVFDQCDTSLGNSTSKLLFKCNEPTALKYFSVVFAEFTADPNALKFEDGKTYYFIGTSDGTQSHLNDLRGGHCNDTENGIFMKIEVYVCKKSNLTHKDENCPEEDVGFLKCRDPTPTTALPTTVLPTTTTSSSSSFMPSAIAPTSITTQAPCTQAAHTSAASTVEAGSVSGQSSVTESKKTTSTEPVSKCPPPQSAEQRSDDRMETDLKFWRTCGIVALGLLFICFVVIIALIRWLCSCRKKKNRPGTVTHQGSSEKNPPLRQKSLGDESNRGFKLSLFARGKKKNRPSMMRDQGSMEKNPASRQESVGGLSNRGFIPSVEFNAGDYGKTTPIAGYFPSFYELPNETSSTGNMELDGKKPVQNDSVVINNKEGHYDNIGSVYEMSDVDGRKPSHDGSVVIENKDVHFAKNGLINGVLAFDV